MITIVLMACFITQCGIVILFHTALSNTYHGAPTTKLYKGIWNIKKKAVVTDGHSGNNLRSLCGRPSGRYTSQLQSNNHIFFCLIK